MNADAPLIAGRYRIGTKLGAGAMGSVFRALDETIGREVALKVFHADVEPQVALREAQTAGRLNHRNIVTIYDTGKTESGNTFLAMEFVAGDTLDAFVSRRRPSTLAERLKLLEQLCEGLSAAHAAGVIHRDIKPTNLLVLHNELLLKIVDFSIARASGLTTLVSGGTPGYMSPEQREGRRPDARSDVYSAGLVASELLSGAAPFPHPSRDDPDWRRPSLGPLVPAGETLDALIAKATATLPAWRFQSANELGEALRAVRLDVESWDEMSTFVRPAVVPDARPAAAITEPAEAAPIFAARTERASERRLGPAAIAVGLALVILLGGAWLMTTWSGTPDEGRVAQPATSTLVQAPATPAPKPPPPGPPSQERRTPLKQPAVQQVEGAGPPGADPGSHRTPVVPPPLPADPQTEESRRHEEAPGPSAEADKAAITAVLEGFALAHRDRSSAALKALQPTLSRPELAALDRAFAESETYDYQIIRPEIVVKDDRAIVTCIIVRRLAVAGADLRVISKPARFELRRGEDARWLVQSHAIAP